jgi:CBS domain containing-hemolysin-like protein
MTSIAVFAVLLAMSLILSAACSSTVTAAFGIGPSDLRAMQKRGGVHRALSWIVAHRRRTLVTVLLLNLVINLFYMNVGQALAESAADRFGQHWRIGVDAVVLLLLVVAGDILPKVVAMRRPREIAALTAVPLYLAEKVLAPARVALTAVADALMRLLGFRHEEGEVTPAELQEVLKLAATKGQLGMDEHEWLRALLDLDQVSTSARAARRSSTCSCGPGGTRSRSTRGASTRSRAT